MPYKDKSRDRTWHREYMRKRRVTPVTPTIATGVTKEVLTVTPFRPYSKAQQLGKR